MDRKVSKEEKVIALLSYLKRYTDRKHPTSIPMISEYCKKTYNDEFFFGDKNTRKNMIKEITRTVNSSPSGYILPEKDWKIVYDDFIRDFGDDSDKEEHSPHHICNIYYNQEFSDDEINKIIHSIWDNPNLTEEDKKQITNKIERHMCSVNLNRWPETPAQRTKRR
ncbi:MAG: hypothetical protein ACI4WM_06820, partial [Erysipelotrichaceae bacterium]